MTVTAPNKFTMQIDKDETTYEVENSETAVTVNGAKYGFELKQLQNVFHVFINGVHTVLERLMPSFASAGADTASSNAVVAPMTGTVVKVCVVEIANAHFSLISFLAGPSQVMVKAGDEVKKGDPVAVMEAMKMEVSC